MASKLGDFYVGIGAMPDITGIDKFGNGLKGITKTAAGIGLTIAGLGAGFVAMVKNTAYETSELGRMSADLGVSVGKLDQFQKMFKLAGGNAQDANNVISELNAQITGFKFGEYQEELGKKLMLAPQDFKENFFENIEMIRQRLALLYKPSERESILNSVGLGAGLRILRLSDREYRQLAADAKATGLATKEQVASSTDFYRNIVLATESFRTFKRELMNITAPEFSKLTKELTKLFADEKFRNNVGEFFGLVIKSLPAVIGGLSFVMKSLIGISNFFSRTSEFKDDIESDYKSGKITKNEYENAKRIKDLQKKLLQVQGAKDLASAVGFSGDEESSYNKRISEIQDELNKTPIPNYYSSANRHNKLSPRNVANYSPDKNDILNKFSGSTIQDNSVYSPQITINATTWADAKEIGSVVEKKLKEHYKQTKENLRSGDI